MQESTYSPRPAPQRLRKDAPNVLVILLDDAGPALASTFGGDVRTPTLDRLAREGVSFNRFHTTAMCSPTRGALLTGRNHHALGQGQIASLVNDWDGYNGVMPTSAASIAKVLGYYGYATSAFGKWHNTPHNETSQAGPFERWPTGRVIGFDYFYGFLAGESSQWEPAIVENFNRIEAPKRDKYHFTEDMTDKAVTWMRQQKAIAPDRPFFMYWAPGAVHGPHHIFKEWADKYKGRFDEGWDAMRERVFARQKALGWTPSNAQLTPRHPKMAAWADIPANERPFQLRLMEVFAGYLEHTDTQAGRLIDELDRLGIRDNTIVLYVWGDNGSSAEGQNGSISEFLAQAGIPTKTADHIRVLDGLGGLDALGGHKTDNHYHAGWAWAGSTPYQGTKLLASHFGGTRVPLVLGWPKSVKADAAPRTQFHHVIDIVPTLYEAIGIKAPKVVDGVPQMRMDGVSMLGAIRDAKASETRKTQYFEIMGSRAIYKDGWMASAMGPRLPWVPGIDPAIFKWTPDQDRWELYDLRSDFSQANDLAQKNPQKLAEMKRAFDAEARANKVYPIGGGLWIGLHPEFTKQNPTTEFHFDRSIVGLPEANAPKLQMRSSVVTIEAELKPDSKGVLYALGGFSGGIAVWVDGGKLNYEYNLYEIERTRVTSSETLPAGKATIEVETKFVPGERIGPADVTLRVNGQTVASGRVPRTTGYSMTGNDAFDVGRDSYSPVSPAYFDRAPFAFDGKLDKLVVKYLPQK
jgi:arylsulfatase